MKNVRHSGLSPDPSPCLDQPDSNPDLDSALDLDLDSDLDLDFDLDSDDNTYLKFD